MGEAAEADLGNGLFPVFHRRADPLTRHPEPKADFSDAIAHYVAENLTLDRMIEDFRSVHEHLRSLGVGNGNLSTPTLGR